jgi:hypothetical protein
MTLHGGGQESDGYNILNEGGMCKA